MTTGLGRESVSDCESELENVSDSLLEADGVCVNETEVVKEVVMSKVPVIDCVCECDNESVKVGVREREMEKVVDALRDDVAECVPENDTLEDVLRESEEDRDDEEVAVCEVVNVEECEGDGERVALVVHECVTE